MSLNAIEVETFVRQALQRKEFTIFIIKSEIGFPVGSRVTKKFHDENKGLEEAMLFFSPLIMDQLESRANANIKEIKKKRKEILSLEDYKNIKEKVDDNIKFTKDIDKRKIELENLNAIHDKVKVTIQDYGNNKECDILLIFDNDELRRSKRLIKRSRAYQIFIEAINNSREDFGFEFSTNPENKKRQEHFEKKFLDKALKKYFSARTI